MQKGNYARVVAGALRAAAGWLALAASPVYAQQAEKIPPSNRPQTGAEFVGPLGCNSSLCHGGAGPNRGSYTIWKNQDVHQRTWETLGSNRSDLMAQAAGSPTALGSWRCTECHMPMQGVPESRLVTTVDPRDGVSCETCHGPASRWIRTHTRTDLDHAQKVALGMRDLESLYVRANTCVACHQNVEPDLLAAGHPDLYFELDGQTEREPRHWEDKGEWFGPQAWFTGQAAALRETSWALAKQEAPNAVYVQQWEALLWLLQTAGAAHGRLGGIADTAPEFSPEAARQIQGNADNLAKAAARTGWDAAATRRTLDALANTGAMFLANASPDKTKSEGLRRKAMRVTLALDRLLAPLNRNNQYKKAAEFIPLLRKTAETFPDFNAEQFSADLNRMRDALAQP